MSSSGKLVTSAQILDGTIVDVDVAAAAAISGTKLGAQTVGASRMNPGGLANTVVRSTDGTTAVFGKVAPDDIADGAVSQAWAASGVPSGTVTQSTAGVWYDLTGASIACTGLTAGSRMLYVASMATRHSAANGRLQLRVVRADTGVAVGEPSGSVSHATASTEFPHLAVGWFSCPVSGSLTFKLQHMMVDAGTATTFPAQGYFHLIELRK